MKVYARKNLVYTFLNDDKHCGKSNPPAASMARSDISNVTSIESGIVNRIHESAAVPSRKLKRSTRPCGIFYEPQP